MWHGQSASTLTPVADELGATIDTLRANLSDVMTDPADQTKRPHEILEDTLRFQLMGFTDQGAGTEYPEAAAAVDATRAVLEQFAPLVTARAPKLLGKACPGLTCWTPRSRPRNGMAAGALSRRCRCASDSR